MAGTAVFPPGPRSRYPFAHLVSFRRDTVGFLEEISRYGDVAYVRMGPRHVYLVTDPELIRDVLVTNARNFTKSRGLEVAKAFLGNGLLTSEGEFHRRQRKLAQPAFHRERIAEYSRVMAQHADRMRGTWRDGEAMDVDHEMMRVALSIVAKTLFDADVEGEAKEIGEALAVMLDVFKMVSNPFAELLAKLPLPANRRFENAKKQLDTIIYRIIAERRAHPGERGDLLSMLMSAQDEDDGQGMTDLQLRDEVTTLFLAGHETTANAMTWTWYLLSQNPEAEAKLHAEVDSVLEGRLPGFEDLPRLAYTRMVMTEAMRLYPPAYAFGRKAIEPYRLGEYEVPAGGTILMSSYVMHRKAAYYPEPEVFSPERWTAEGIASRPKFSYIPFGGGPRVCIGEQFAWAEGILVIAAVAQQWRLRLVPGHPVALYPQITLRPKYGMRMVGERRGRGELAGDN